MKAGDPEKPPDPAREAKLAARREKHAVKVWKANPKTQRLQSEKDQVNKKIMNKCKEIEDLEKDRDSAEDSCRVAHQTIQTQSQEIETLKLAANTNLQEIETLKSTANKQLQDMEALKSTANAKAQELQELQSEKNEFEGRLKKEVELETARAKALQERYNQAKAFSTNLSS